VMGFDSRPRAGDGARVLALVGFLSPSSRPHPPALAAALVCPSATCSAPQTDVVTAEISRCSQTPVALAHEVVRAQQRAIQLLGRNISASPRKSLSYPFESKLIREFLGSAGSQSPVLVPVLEIRIKD
jgi:hypothetical protein